MTLRVGIVGCGAAARRLHLPGLRAAGADVVAFASRSRQSAEIAAAEWGAGGFVAGAWQELLDRQDVDAIDVCTPNALHAEIAVAAAQAGKHVLVEKPMACCVADAESMMRAAAENEIVLMPAQSGRFLAPFIAMGEAVASGGVGRLLSFRCAWGHAGPQHWAPAAGWFRELRAAGGGALTDLGVHAADTLRAVLGDEAVEVTALLARGAGEVEEIAQVLLRLSQGAIGSLQASWVVANGRDHQLTVQGTGGTLHLDDRTAPTLLRAGVEPVELPLPSNCPTVFDAFVSAVTTGAPPAVSALDGRAAVAIIEAAYASAASGQSVGIAAAAGLRPSQRSS
jgi:predicted dehydrogenase